jgi:Asp-tRNA(Asn)/Glu-tRNA(Gln) amidotransferase A subunit family amidase
LSPVELVQAPIERTERLCAAINVFTYVFPEWALQAARAAEAVYARPSGAPRPLEGIPIAIKDLHAFAGEITTYASCVYAEHVDTDTIPTNQRLLDAGAAVAAGLTTPADGSDYGGSIHIPASACERARPWSVASEE